MLTNHRFHYVGIVLNKCEKLVIGEALRIQGYFESRKLRAILHDIVELKIFEAAILFLHNFLDGLNRNAVTTSLVASGSGSLTSTPFASLEATPFASLDHLLIGKI
uniref:Uncharacterized protein n=1 Tax=viral metagenome TaxID=1070528 RepID=A0A6C0L750_9ZZZZ